MQLYYSPTGPAPQGIELSEITLQGISWPRGQATRLGHGRRRAGQRPLGRPGQPRRASSSARSPCKGCQCYQAWPWPQASRTTSARQTLASPAGHRAQRDHPARDQLAKGPAGEHPPGRALPLADLLCWSSLMRLGGQPGRIAAN